MLSFSLSLSLSSALFAALQSQPKEKQTRRLRFFHAMTKVGEKEREEGEGGRAKLSPFFLLSSGSYPAQWRTRPGQRARRGAQLHATWPLSSCCRPPRERREKREERRGARRAVSGCRGWKGNNYSFLSHALFLFRLSPSSACDRAVILYSETEEAQRSLCRSACARVLCSSGLSCALESPPIGSPGCNVVLVVPLGAIALLDE